MAYRNTSSDDEDSNASFSNERIKLTIRKNQITQDNWTCTIAASTAEEADSATQEFKTSATDGTRATSVLLRDVATSKKPICDLSTAPRSVPYVQNSRLFVDKEPVGRFEHGSHRYNDIALSPVLASAPARRKFRSKSSDAAAQAAPTAVQGFALSKTIGNKRAVSSSRSCLSRGKFVPYGQMVRADCISQDAGFACKQSKSRVDASLSVNSGDSFAQKRASAFLGLLSSRTDDSKCDLPALLQRFLDENFASYNLLSEAVDNIADTKLGARERGSYSDCDSVGLLTPYVSSSESLNEMPDEHRTVEKVAIDSSRDEYSGTLRNSATFVDSKRKMKKTSHSSKCKDLSTEQQDSLVSNSKCGQRADFAEDDCNASSSESAFSNAEESLCRCDVDLKVNCKTCSKAEHFMASTDPDGRKQRLQECRGPEPGSSSLEQAEKRSLRPRRSKYSSPFCLKGKRKNRASKGGLLVQIQANFLSSAGFSASPPRSPDPRLHDNDLTLKTPVVNVSDENVAYSDGLAKTCVCQPLCLLKGLCRAVNIDLKIFSSKVLKQEHGDHPMEIRIQRRLCEPTADDSQEPSDWGWYSFPSQATISKYATYQASSFVSHQKKMNKTKPLSKSLKLPKCEKSGSLSKIRKNLIYFGTNADLSDKIKWKAQIKELEKLPEFLQVNCPGQNMLNHIGHDVFGVNTVQLYMKVPGSRTPGHQENNNFCSVNVNIGPGSCEWFCVPANYWGVLLRMCQDRRIDYLNGSWWPDLQDLRERCVPVYQCKQDPGDVIWIGPGTVHWVQAVGWCNNVAWNVGPMTNDQYMMALERYEFNKSVLYKSIVPMLQVSWNVAASVRITDAELRESMMRILSMSLQNSSQVKEYVCSLNKEIRFQERLPGELTRYCSVCNEEVYNIVFAARNKVFCFKCATGRDTQLRGFHVLEEYDWNKLLDVYQNFVQRK